MLVIVELERATDGRIVVAAVGDRDHNHMATCFRRLAERDTRTTTARVLRTMSQSPPGPETRTNIERTITRSSDPYSNFNFPVTWLISRAGPIESTVRVGKESEGQMTRTGTNSQHGSAPCRDLCSTSKQKEQ